MFASWVKSAARTSRRFLNHGSPPGDGYGRGKISRCSSLRLAVSDRRARPASKEFANSRKNAANRAKSHAEFSKASRMRQRRSSDERRVVPPDAKNDPP